MTNFVHKNDLPADVDLKNSIYKLTGINKRFFCNQSKLVYLRF